MLEVKAQTFRVGCFVLALLLYGALGSPTPDDPGLLEAVIAGLLVLAVGVSGAVNALKFGQGRQQWKSSAQVFLIFGLSVPLIGGVIDGNGPGFIIRDVIPFLFLFLPLFMAVRNRVLILYGVLAVGVLFGVRAGFDVPVLGGGDKLFYLANMPSVLFAAVFFAGTSASEFVARFNTCAVVKGLVFAGLAAVCLHSILEMQQRASVGVFVLSMAAVFSVCLWERPWRAAVVLAVLVVALVLFLPELRSAFETLNRKSELVGVNMRGEEWRAVWAEISGNPFSLLVGKGWGATFSSPAVADIEVNFTHGLVSSLLLKTGLIGAGLGVFYLCALGRGLLNAWRAHPVLVVALAGPILIDVFLYASFKSLDFGLMLLLAAHFGFYGDGNVRGVEMNASVLYAKEDSTSL
jgi:hypothetical protein